MKFDIDIAIEDKGNCARQQVLCEECKMGVIISSGGGKERLDDLCSHNIVYFLAAAIKIWEKSRTK